MQGRIAKATLNTFKNNNLWGQPYIRRLHIH